MLHYFGEMIHRVFFRGGWSPLFPTVAAVFLAIAGRSATVPQLCRLRRLRHTMSSSLSPTACGMARSIARPRPPLPNFLAAGVDFVNSHSLMPTITTANASAIATGHLIGDTGNFANNLFTGFLSIESDKFAAIANVEDDSMVLRDLDDHFSGNYFGEETLLAAARRAGYHTAAIGKLGPTVIQDVTQNNAGLSADQVATVIIDDATGFPGGPPLIKSIRDRIAGDAIS